MIWKKSEADETTAQPHIHSHTPVLPQAQPQPQPAAVTFPRGQGQAVREGAFIGPSIEINGNLTGGEDLFIEGRFEGKIELRQHSVTVGKSGHLKADIYGRTILVQGEVEGNLYGDEQIVLRQSSTVRGNLLAPRVTLEDGSNFNGSIDMTLKGAAETPALPAAASESKSVATQIPWPERTAEQS